MAVAMWLVLSLLPQDVDVLLERLRSDDFQVREEAERTLIDRGPAVLPSLKKHQKDPDVDFRVRVCRAIEEISRRRRVQAVRPAPVRVTVRLEDVPLSQALKEVLGPFGVQADLWPRDLGERRVSLTLREASVWAALDAITAAGRVHLENEYTMPQLGWRFRDGPPSSPGPSIEIDGGRFHAEARRSDNRVELSLHGRLPAGSLPAAVGVEDVVLIEGSDGKIPLPGPSSDAVAWRRAAGPTSIEPVKWTVERGKLQDCERLSLRGTIVLKYPKDVERAEFAIREFKGPAEATLGGVTLTLKSVTAAGGQWGHETEGMKWPPGTPEQRFRDWFETADGRLYAECCAFHAGGKNLPGRSTSLRGTEEVLPVKFVIARLIGEDPTRFPFELKDVPIR